MGITIQYNGTDYLHYMMGYIIMCNYIKHEVVNGYKIS